MATFRASSQSKGAVECGRHIPGFRVVPYVGQLVATLVFFLICLASSPLGWVLHQVAGDRIPARTGQKFLRCLFRLFTWWMRFSGMLRIEVRGLESLQEARSTIFISNHPALLDAIFLMTYLPPTACVMRANLLRNPLMCGNALIGGYVTNDSGPAFVRQGIEKIRAGGNLLIFPEGSRTLTPPVNRFKHGFAMVAARSGATVQTVLIEYEGSHLTKGTSLFTPATLPLQFVIRAGDRFHPEPGEAVPAFSQRMESWFRRELEKPSSIA